MSLNGAENMEKATSLTTKDKESVLKMAGVLIRTVSEGVITGKQYRAYLGQEPIAVTYDYERCLNAVITKIERGELPWRS